MAKSEEDREDLMQEATALVRRGEYNAPQEVELVTIGFRTSGALSLYFGQDPVYQFNDAAQLRRGYIDGDLFKAENARLIRMRRERDQPATTLVSTPLSDVDQAELMIKLEWRLSTLAESIEEGDVICNTTVPDETDVAAEFLAWWRQRQMNIEIAAAPNVVAPKA